MKNKNEIEDELESILAELPQAYQPDFNRAKIKNLSLKILDLTHEIVIYLDGHELLSAWAKHRIVDVMSSLNWGWLYAALSELELAIYPDKVSPDNKYREEITNLNVDEMIRHIISFKKNLEKG
jgi:hypothetical protein